MSHFSRIVIVLIAATCSAAPGAAWAGALEEILAASCPLDTRLNNAASTALDHHEPLDGEQLRRAAELHGALVPGVRAWVGRGDAAAIAIAVDDWLHAQDSNPAWSRCALAHDGALWALVMAPRTAVIAGVEPSVAMGTTSHYRITLPRGASNAELVLVQPDGVVARASAGSSTDVQFEARGTYALQVLGTTSLGPLPFATWHVVVGSPVATHADDAQDEAPPLETARHVLRAINLSRNLAHAPRLRSDPMLTAAAEARATELAARGRVAHGLDVHDLPVARLERAHLGADRVAENVARARSLTAASARLDASPSHHAIRVDANLDAVGIGIAVAGESVYLVELYASHPRIDARP